MTHNKKVIQFPEPELWVFWDICYGKSNPIQDWLDGLSNYARELFRNTLKDAQKITNPKDWPAFKRFLKGGDLEKNRIWELQFYADGKPYRVLGIFGDQRKHAILLIGCYHKQRNYTPSGALESSCKRAKDFREGRAGKIERKISTGF